MTKRAIIAFRALNRLAKRFQVQGPGADAYMEDFIQPTIDVGELSCDFSIQSAGVETETAGRFAGLTVPKGKRWEVQAVSITRQNGAPTFDAAIIATLAALPDALVFASQAAGSQLGWTGRMVLTAGMTIGAQLAAGAAGDDTFVRALVCEYDDV